jgi:hypothetical protein
MQVSFGSGLLFGIPLTDGTGAAITNPTPVQFGVLQDVSVDISFEAKMLHGQNQFPVASGRGKGKISGKAKFARINGLLMNSLFFGQTLAAGIIAVQSDFLGTAIPASPFTITVTPPNSGTWQTDMGVKDANGNPMTRVASAPTAGQYSVTAGAYLFAAADTGKIVFISYEYTATSTTAKKIDVNNLPMGYAPTFLMSLSRPFNGAIDSLKLYSCQSNKLGVGGKNDDFNVAELDFDAFADGAGRVLSWGTSE